MMQTIETPTERRQRTVMRVLAGVGVIALLIGAGWVGVRLVQALPGSMSSLASTFTGVRGAVNGLNVSSSPEAVEAGDVFTISWELDEDENKSGSYTLSYPCVDGIHLETTTGETVFCNTDFRFLNENDSVSLMASKSEAGVEELPITVDFTENGKSKVSLSGVVTLDVGTPDVSFTIGPNATSTATSTDDGGDIAGTTTTPTVPTPPTTVPGPTTLVRVDREVPENPNGQADLVVRVLDTGILNSSDKFISRDPVDPKDRVAIKFEVENTGDKSSGKWKFEVEIPLDNGDYTFKSKTQDSLFPSGTIEYTLGFDDVEDDKGDDVLIEIDIDTGNDVDESKENNNKAARRINLE